MSPKSLIQLSDSLRSLYIKTAKKLKGSDRRQFMAEVVKGWGRGGATIAERELGWNRRTIRTRVAGVRAWNVDSRLIPA
jgi:hypothetical protein